MNKTQRPAAPSWKQYNRPWYSKLANGFVSYFKNAGIMIWNVIKSIPFKIWGLILAVGHCFQGLWFRFKKGDWRTRVSYLIMGFGCFSRSPKQILKGLLLLAIEALFIVYMIFIGAPNLYMMGSLGDVALKRIESQLVPGLFRTEYVDNSLSILLFSVMTLMLMVFFVYIWIKNTKIAYNTQKLAEAGKELSGPKQQLNYALNDG